MGAVLAASLLCVGHAMITVTLKLLLLLSMVTLCSIKILAKIGEIQSLLMHFDATF